MRYVALLRGINVGGHKKVPMKSLHELLRSLGHTGVSTYIQSGNAIFTSPRDDLHELGREIELAITRDLGFEVPVLLRTRDEMAAVVDGNPFGSATVAPTTLHVTFLSAPPDDQRLSEIDAHMFEPDEFSVGDRVVYLWLPNGSGATKLTHLFWERRFGLRATTRNWNTVTKLLTLATV